MPRKYGWLLAIALSIVVADQGTKFLVLDGLTSAFEGAASRGAVFFGAPPKPGFDGYHFRPREQIVLSDDFFRLRYAENPGAAFGLFRTVPERYRAPLFHLVTLGAGLLVFSYYARLRGVKGEGLARLGLPLVLGGAVGNYIDRVARGFVIDFLEAHWRELAYWPAFNVADIAVVTGVGLLLVDGFVRKDAPARAA